MKFKRPSRRQLQSLCGEVRPDDGIDPKELSRPKRKREAANRKARQLCGQVADTLNLVLSGECGDELLRNLQVVAVTPAPDATQLLVLVAQAVEGELVDATDVLARLGASEGRLRALVAAAITRRRAPKLLFQYAPGPSVGEASP